MARRSASRRRPPPLPLFGQEKGGREHICHTCGARACHGIGHPILPFGEQQWFCHDHWLRLPSTVAMHARMQIDMGGE